MFHAVPHEEIFSDQLGFSISVDFMTPEGDAIQIYPHFPTLPLLDQLQEKVSKKFLVLPNLVTNHSSSVCHLLPQGHTPDYTPSCSIPENMCTA